MFSQAIRILVLFFGVGVFALAGYFGFAGQVGANSPQTRNEAAEQVSGKPAGNSTTSAGQDFGNLPLYFTSNQGQADRNVKYYSTGSRYGLFLTRGGATLQLVAENAGASRATGSTPFEKSENFRAEQVHINFVGADMCEPPAGEDELPGKVNYFVGGDASQWKTNVSTFGKIRYKNIYPGIDALFYGNQRELEYDFVVAPRANPASIALEFDGAKKVVVNRAGELVLKLENGDILQRRPVAYQFIDGERREVAVRFVKKGDRRIAFQLGRYDSEKELVIDPIIVFSTFFGGSSTESATAVKTDAEGNIYLTGATVSPNFPTVNPVQPTFGGNFSFDAFVTKINAAGNSVIYSTYLGGSAEDFAASLSVDAAGNAVVAGRTYSSNFPTINALQTQIGGNADGFVTKLNPTGSALTYSTFLGGAAFEEISGATTDAGGNTVVVGRTESGDFPTVNPLQATRAGTSVFRSFNAGDSWAGGAISPGVTTVSAFAVNPLSPNTVYAGTNIGVFRSSDGGSNWTTAGTADLAFPVSKIVVARPNPNVLYAISGGAIFKSSNAGDNWTSIQGNLFSFFNAVAVDPNNADIVFAGGSGGAVYKSINGGTNWTNVSLIGVSAAVNSLAIDPSNTQIVYVGTTQRIHKSTVGGGSWAAATNGISLLTTFWDLFINPANNTIYAATQIGLFKSTDSAASWTQINNTNLTAVRSLAQDANNASSLYAATSNGFFFRSLDGGATWNQNNNGLGGGTLFAVAASSTSTLLGGYSGTDAFVARLNGAGNALNYSTFFGGGLNDSATSVRVDSAGKIVLVGTTNSSDFPVSNAFQTAFGGGNDAFAAKLGEGGASLIYSTFLGGASNDSATSVAVDGDGNAYLTGNTVSTNFPVQNALQPACASCVSFSSDAFVAKLNSGGTALVYSTFLGGAFADNASSIAVDSQNRVIVAGSTSSNNFPVFDAIQPAGAGGTDGFVSQINADGSSFVYSTYFGGSGNEGINSLAIAPEGNAVVAGNTQSFNFPIVRPIQSAFGGGQDAFIAKIGVNADLEIVKTDERDPVMVNNSLVYNLRVKNNGPSAATDVVVTDVLPAGVNFVSAIPTQGTCAVNASTLTCNPGALASDAQASIRVILTPTQTGTVSGTATIRANEPDSVSANNSDVEQTLISASPSIVGRVANGNGQPAADVGISVEGFQNRTTQTNAAGAYSVNELPAGGNYTVRPVKPGYYFSPRSKSFSSLTRDETADFVINACSYTLSATAVNVNAAGGNQSVFVTANDAFCAWTATSNAPWISITAGSGGFGNGTVKLSIQPSAAPRTGTLTIAGQTFTVTQTGCSFTLTPFQQSFGQNGGTGTIAVTANQSFCQWNAVAADPWITVTNGSSGNGNGTVSYTIAAANRPRSGRIVVAGQIFPVWQEFNYCPAPGFDAPIEPTINADSSDIVTADFNNDSNPDLATVDATSTQASTFTTYIGGGNGTFSRTTRASTIGTFTSLTVGDFNRDSKVDIALAGSGQIAVYNGDGAGGFALFTTFNATTSNFTKIFPGDFNNDGKTDLLVGVSNGIYVYNGNGDGTFAAGANLPIAGRYTYSFAVGDLNGDGMSDVVAGNEEDFNIPRLMYFFGSAAGTFSPGGTISLGTVTPFNVKVADFNGDGRADVVTNGYGASQVQVFLWNPSANAFRTAIRVFTEPFTGYTFDVADMNNDGKPDIISASSQDFPRRVNVMRGNGNGTFRPAIGSASVGAVNAMAFADFNRDGRTDLAFGKKVNQMAVQLSQCNPAAAERIGSTKFDFDGDRKADFAVVRPSDNTWHIYQGANKPLISQQFGTGGDVFVPADYDGDGRTDIAVFRPTDGIWYRLNSSDNSFAAEKWGQTGDVPVPADFDGDERADLAVYRPENGEWHWVGSLDGQIHSQQFGLGEDVPVAGDYDGDAKADIAVFRPSNGYWYRLNSSNGDFQAFQFGLSTDKAVPADYDGDGLTDIAVYRPTENVWYLIKSSVNQFSAVKFGADGDVPTPADYDGDGRTDIAVFRSGTWYVLNSASGGLTANQFGAAADKPVPSVYIR